MRKTTWMLIAGTVAAGVLWAATPQAQTNQEKLEISAFAVNMSNIATGSNAQVQITINSWSTAEERERLITTVLEKGSDALLRELQKAPVKGRFRIPTARQPDPHHLALGLDLHYAMQTPLEDGGRRIVIATDRYIGFQEARSQPRSIDYPITLMEIRVDKEGNGMGKMAVATKISFDKKKNQIELENYASEPVRLQNVKVTVKT
jgi:hypothetical protein